MKVSCILTMLSLTTAHFTSNIRYDIAMIATKLIERGLVYVRKKGI